MHHFKPPETKKQGKITTHSLSSFLQENLENFHDLTEYMEKTQEFPFTEYRVENLKYQKSFIPQTGS